MLFRSCLYFQMHTCSRPCNDDIGRASYLADVDEAIAFIQGADETLNAEILKQINALAAEEKFEDAELLNRRMEKLQRARKEQKDRFPSVWGFDYLVLLPGAGIAQTKVAFVRSGTIIHFAAYETTTLQDVIPAEVTRLFSGPADAANREWQYDEFCLVSNYLVHPLKSVELVRLIEGVSLSDYLRKRGTRKARELAVTEAPSPSEP